ncbi:hypothetical protein H310_06949 [Aphanomyces invadans]|uniref:Uncharacterized protein n=1 Tax=Aphanomyces invadans TaxID=157072 RepID=A0A024U4W2_9STRA|nr:hypothetical protein H310_06949 [Aphanomyces invadans]ETW01421.1 hypothetical protein H310_06949 [Aphanomyces invadans]|eukprot:XP_008870419.1 hypothetical protein H310_06949 [Aphanomyces invadans]
MSTLTSTQMNVRRSSTRVHGPPGGASQLTFGPGGFGTSAPESDPELRDSAPQLRADFLPQKPTHGSSAQRGSMPCPSNNQQQPPPFQRPPPTGYAQPPPTGFAQPPQTAYGVGPPPTSNGHSIGRGYPHIQPNQFNTDPRPVTTGSSGWGANSQPPLTSSKRDQNWEKKRRQWLARKNGGGRSSGGYASGGGSSYAPSTAGGYDNPPSPLSKLMHHVSIGGHDASFQMPPRTPQSFQQPPPRTALYPDPATSYGHQGGFNLQQPLPPPTQQGAYPQMDPPRTSYVQDNYRGVPPPGTGCPPSRQGTATAGSFHENFGGPRATSVLQHSGAAQFGNNSFNSRHMANGSVPSTAASGRSVRQAPGGTSNWSPYG